MPTIAVIGPGAVGGTVAAWLSQSPANIVTVCARTAFDRLLIDAPDGPISASPAILTAPAAASPVDWILIATKAYDTAGAASWLAGLMGPETRVAVLQNGVEHVARFSPHVPVANIVPVIVDIPAERLGPGRIVQRRNGTMLVPATKNGEAFVALFAHTPIAAATTDDFTTAAWKKLAINCAGIVCALTMKPGGVVAKPGIAEVMRALVRECVAVGRAEGALLPDDLPETVVGDVHAAPSNSINSIYGDRLAGRPTEVDARNGVIVRLGALHGVATPMNAAMAALLEASAG